MEFFIGKKDRWVIGEEFVEGLIPFWMEILSETGGAPYPADAILIFVSPETSEKMTIYQVHRSWRESWDQDKVDGSEIVVKKLLCPFTYTPDFIC